MSHHALGYVQEGGSYLVTRMQSSSAALQCCPGSSSEYSRPSRMHTCASTRGMSNPPLPILFTP